MAKYPYGVLDINNDSIVLTKEMIEHSFETCKFAAERAKEQGDEESFSYFKGRAGVFDALLENWRYNETKQN